MYSLNKAIDLVSRWPSSKQQQRTEVAALLDGLIARCQDAIKVWQGYVKSPGAPGDRFSLVTWVGADRSRQLFDIHLAARRQAQRLCDLAGPAAGRLLGLDDDVIEMAYRQLGEGETGAQAAEKALARLDQRIQYLNDLKQRLRAAPPAKAVSPARKPGAKPTGKKPAPAKKKPVAKKAAKKKK
jgi:hypothetical protein